MGENDSLSTGNSTSVDRLLRGSVVGLVIGFFKVEDIIWICAFRTIRIVCSLYLISR